MGVPSTSEKQSKKANPTTGHQAKAPIAMSSADHNAFVDLLFQEAAQSAKSAVTITDPKAMLALAGQSVARARAALTSYTMPDIAPSPAQLFRTVDGAFMGLYDLFYVVRDQKDESVSTYAPEIQAVMADINDRFAPLGWKVPKTDVEGQARAKASHAAGLATLTTGEKGRLGRMHIRAARQYIVGGWQEISSGNLGAASIAAHNLADAMTVLIDPKLANEMDAMADEVGTTEQVFSRLVMAIEQNDASKLGGLRELAQRLDALLRLVGKDPIWVAKVQVAAPASKPSGPPPAGPLAQGAEPARAAPGQGTKNGAGPTGAASNELDRGAPRAEPGMHRIAETHSYTKKVHIRDSYLGNEYLGYIELAMEVFRTESGQVYTTKATATKHLEDRAGEYLSMGADVVAHSVSLNGQQYCDVFFDVQVGGPNKTSTTAVSVGAKASAQNASKDRGGEISAGVVFSTSVTSQGTRAFRRVFRISSLGKPVDTVQFDPDAPFAPPKLIQTQLTENERKDLHQDFEGFELDDDDVGDDVFSFYSNWILHSSSE